MRQICINCAPLAGKVTGIERCMTENLKRLDRLAEKAKTDIVLLYPAGAEMHFPPLRYLKTVPIKSKGKKMQIRALKKYLRAHNGLYCSMHGGLCIQCGAVICIHDIRTWLHKEYDPLLFRLKCNINAISGKLLAGKLVTVSETAKEELSEHLKISASRIDVISHGWEHILDVVPDERVFERLPFLQRGSYFYSLSSRAPHKNFKWVEEVARRNPEKAFLVGGKRWKQNDRQAKPPGNLHYLGYVTDEENIALMRNCRAFLHPSKYEGFGLTPLEALACGTPVCVAAASCLPEVFGDMVHYFDPDDYEVDLDALLEGKIVPPDRLLQKYSWERSARQWLALLEFYAKE